MPKQPKTARIGVYECNLHGNSVSKVKWVKGYYELYHHELLESMIIPDLRDAKRAGWDFDFPVLVVSYLLGPGDPPKPLPRPQSPLTVKSAGGLTNLRRMVGIPIRRKKIAKTEAWEAVIDDHGQVFEVEGIKLKNY